MRIFANLLWLNIRWYDAQKWVHKSNFTFTFRIWYLTSHKNAIFRCRREKLRYAVIFHERYSEAECFNFKFRSLLVIGSWKQYNIRVLRNRFIWSRLQKRENWLIPRSFIPPSPSRGIENFHTFPSSIIPNFITLYIQLPGFVWNSSANTLSSYMMKSVVGGGGLQCELGLKVAKFQIYVFPLWFWITLILLSMIVSSLILM